MKVPSNIESCLSTHGYNRQNLSQKDFNTVKNPDLFITLLADKIKNIKDPDKLNSATLPLNKNYLQRLIDVVQGQMNDYLFRELSEFDKDSDLPGFNCEWMNFHGAENLEASFVSKIEHDPQKGKEIKSPPEINDIIEHASKIYEVDPELIRSVVQAESDFDANATSSKGAMGLMQLMPETAKDLGVKNCYNPVENIMAGTRYLKSLLNRYDGNVELTLAAYNWGMGNVERHPDRLPEETRTYIARVNGYLQKGTS
ncbi:MAG: lytic transglycosylase domain-containing protein [Desulfobacterales bacterium]|jgi:hypothetical protein|nr:lytic transglycosylase domain-containing protein [Desulfobacterales bacterium]